MTCKTRKWLTGFVAIIAALFAATLISQASAEISHMQINQNAIFNCGKC